MKPLRITIKGSYLDCQIYRGWLYLWSFDGKLSVYDWNAIVDYLCNDKVDELAFKFSFTDSHYLYKHSLVDIFSDNDFVGLLKNKFKKLELYKLTISEKLLRRFLIGEMDTPSGQLPIDTEIYNSYLYYCVDGGLFRVNAHKTKGSPVSCRPMKLWDARLLSLKANKYPQLALSAGDDGLYELSVMNEGYSLYQFAVEKQIFRVSERHSSFANYSNLSIYSSSLSNKSFLALYNWNKSTNKKATRVFSDIIDSSTIFGDFVDELSWGVDGKFFRAVKSGFNSVSFNNYEKEKRFTARENYKHNLDKGEIIGGASAHFGNIVEYENSMSIILTDNTSFNINHPITRWRIYPRSINYANQLHVLLDDEMRIYSFNHDYFISQFNKPLGIDYKDDERRYY